MKILRLIFSTILFLTLVTGIYATVLYFKGNMEKKELTDNDRKGTPGQYIKLSRGITHYELGGPDTGNVVILVHGFSVPYYIWDGTYQYLVKQGFRVLRYDMYGRGYSDRPDVIYNQELYQTQLLDLIKQLHLKTPVSLAGVSFGGAIVTNFTCKYPNLVNKVILVDPVYHFGPSSAPEFYTLFDEATHGDDRANGQLTDFKHPEKHTDWVQKYRFQMQYKGFRNAIVSTRYDYKYNGRQSYTSLNNTHKHVLLIWGKDDHTVPFQFSDSVRSVLKVDFFPVDDAAHLPHIEQADKVNAKILEFLRNVDFVKSDSLKPKISIQKRTISADFKIGIRNPHPTDDDCVFTNHYSVAERLKKYPFSKALKIVAVSFRYMDRRREYLTNDSVKIYDDGIHAKVPDSLLHKNPFDIQYESGLHVKNQKLNYSSLIEIQNLSGKQIEKFTNLIYNTTVRKQTDYADPGYTCYSPRNAIVFFDKNGKVYDYLEVCFECMHYRTLSDKFSIGTYCNQKYDLLRQFFIDTGIDYGTIKK
ncbi:alpha/beta fold hydrolase [Mucilaginibacter gotjawali]|uniref:Pimeloyl-ACP methyl ester carboxylesterase n=2 Tax=Mucilaginibacter gotjawali TaxID=1550579 RepID=A0A839SFJ1_9SPHI|nr:alpha/beta hydrolase [Mucilaginibacter gotjawali]MBB3056044.1 pimeloyl-ACP methyl ester carboxylesterase [Mucilaginibacter gotjawali]BAU53620.1 Non-heme chloroperoxidase [Mucilaginibacter gotjawali]